MPVRVAARRAALALVLAMLAALVLAGPASAHAELASISPANGERLDAAPPDVVFTFTESVNLVDDGLRLVDEVGADVPTPEPTVDGATVTWPMPDDLAKGSYVITWRVVSADGHPIAGASAFGIGTAVPATTSTPVEAEALPPTAPWWVVAARLAGYLSFALVAGVVAFVVLCWPPAGSVARLQTVLRVGLVGGLATGVLGLLLQGPYAAGLPPSRSLGLRLLQETLASPFGRAMVWRLALYAVLVALAWWLPAVARGTTRWLALGAVVGVAIAIAAAGHGASTGRLVDLLVDALHALTAGIWVGGLVVLVVLGRGVAREAVRHFSVLAMTSVIALVVTGTVNSLRDLDSISQLWTSRYGVTLLVKLGVVVAALGAAMFSRARVQRDGVPVRSVQLEAALTVVVLAVTATLTMTTPPPTVAASFLTAGAVARPDPNAQVEMTLGDQGSATLAVIPATTQGSRLHLVTNDATGLPSRARSVRLKLENPGRDIAALPVPLKRRNGVWVASFRFPLPGKWNAVLTVDAGRANPMVTSGEVRVFR